MKELELKYGCNPNQKPSRIYMENGELPIKESTAKHEGYDKTSIVGVIEPTNDYPGCPYCKAQSFVICSCGRLNCDNTSGLGGLFTCEWCGTTGKLGIYDGSGFDSSGDR